jgi:hypothetical protein
MFDHALGKLPTTSIFPREELPPHMQAEPLGFEARQINAECRQKRVGEEALSSASLHVGGKIHGERKTKLLAYFGVHLYETAS